MDTMKANISANLAANPESKQYPVSRYATSYVLSEEQLHAWDRDGYLVVPNAVPAETIAQLDGLANEISALPMSDASNGVPHPWLVHHEQVFCQPEVKI